MASSPNAVGIEAQRGDGAGAFVNRIATCVPPHDVHEPFIRFAESQLRGDRRNLLLFRRLVSKGGIEHRYSFLAPLDDPKDGLLDVDGLFVRGHFPATGARMRFFERHAPVLGAEAVRRLELDAPVTHLLVTCCTGLSAPGLDLEIVDRCGLPTSIERVTVGFMGCYAAINALRLARHIVRSDPAARVLIVSLELCTLHLKETTDLEEMLSFLLWGDGAAACLVSAEPTGFALDRFTTVLPPSTRELMTWNIRDAGFDMRLSGRVPQAIHDALLAHSSEILAGASPDAVDLWAVHPGGRSILDAIERALELEPSKLSTSRSVLRRFGNMSSATVLFVLEELLRTASAGASGCAMSFGPGLVAETMLFHSTG